MAEITELLRLGDAPRGWIVLKAVYTDPRHPGIKRDWCELLEVKVERPTYGLEPSRSWLDLRPLKPAEERPGEPEGVNIFSLGVRLLPSEVKQMVDYISAWLTMVR